MATSDSDHSSHEWELVNPTEESADESSSASSLEFVQLEDGVASFHSKEKESGHEVNSQDIEDRRPSSPCSSASDLSDTSSEVDLVGAVGGELKHETNEAPVSPDFSEGTFTLEKQESKTDSTGELSPEEGPQSDSSLEILNVEEEGEEEEEEEMEDVAEDFEDGNVSDEDVRVEQVHAVSPPIAPRPNEHSDSDSDFVRLDQNLSEENIAAMPEAMQASTSSNSSIGSNFRFLRYPVRQDSFVREEDEDSIPGDVDDRVESDISGVAGSDEEEDWSVISNGIEGIPLVEGNVKRSYKHRPNTDLNSVLTYIVLITFGVAFCVGIGHFIGSFKDYNLRTQQVAQMKMVQDEYLMCLREKDSLEDVIKKQDMEEERLTVVLDIWREKFQNTIQEEAGMEIENKQLKLKNKKFMEQLSTLKSENPALLERIAEQQKAYNLMAQEYENMQQMNQNRIEENVQTQKLLAETITELEILLKTEQEKSLKTSNVIKSMKDRLNQLETENADLKTEIAKLRYGLHPPNDLPRKEAAKIKLKGQLNELIKENSDLKNTVGKIRYSKEQSKALEMRKEMNQLVTENTDLKNVVGKIRYTKVPAAEVAEEEKQLAPSAVHQEADAREERTVCEPETLEMEWKNGTSKQFGGRIISRQDYEALQKLVSDATDALNIEKGRSEMWQSLFVAARVEKDEALKLIHNFNPKFLACMKVWFPNLEESAMIRTLQKVDLRNWVMHNPITENLKSNWEQFRDFMDSPNFDKSKASGMYREILDEFVRKWEEFEKAQPLVKETMENAKSKMNNVVDAIKNVSQTQHLQEYINKTKEAVTELGRKVQNTWEQLINISGDLLNDPDNPAVKVAERISKKIHKFGKKMESKWDNVKDFVNKKGWSGDNREKHQDKKLNRRQRQHKKGHSKKTGDEKFYNYFESMKDHKKVVNNKPSHKQRQSNHEHDEYKEFWGSVGFEPDDILHEGFFEGNNRQWQKYQKRFHRLHGRIHRLNEDILYSMDDDDIEDLYDDLDDFMDDLDKDVQPERLTTWLTCQTRWWKSRFQRKNRNDNFIQGCGGYLLKWQVRALCQANCHGNKCRRGRSFLPKDSPFCKSFYAFEESQDSCSKGKMCHDKNLQNHPKGFQTYNQGSEPTHLEPPAQDPVNPVVNVTLDWSLMMEKYLGQVRHNLEKNYYGNRKLANGEPRTALPPGGQKRHRSTPEQDLSWWYDRAVDLEYRQHKTDWIFERAEERDFERNKPWYVKRAEDREVSRRLN